MSADYRTEHMTGYGHDYQDDEPTRIAVFDATGRDQLLSIDKESLAEFVELAEQAWPGLSEDLADAASARAAAEDSTAAQPDSTVVHPVTEYGVVTPGGTIRIRNALHNPEVDRIYPLTDWLAGLAADGQVTFQRTILVIDDWGPVTP